MKTLKTRSVPVLGGALEITTNIAGTGTPLVFLHSAGGFYWDDCLDRLADRYTVYAPFFPGTEPGKPDLIKEIEDLWSAVIAYDDLLDGLGLERSILMGQSLGGMLACELAAQRRQRVDKLVLVAPIGLWRADTPYTVADWCVPEPDELPAVLFHRLDEPRVRKRLALPDGEEAAALAQVHFIWTVGCTSKIVWPIPDKGLDRRIHRVTAPTLIVWGENDRLVPPIYAGEFQRALPAAELCMVAECGHDPLLEQCDVVSEKIGAFLAR
jgi:pimeloyl-ACP methyl ester carboxylesterase